MYSVSLGVLLGAATLTGLWGWILLRTGGQGVTPRPPSRSAKARVKAAVAPSYASQSCFFSLRTAVCRSVAPRLYALRGRVSHFGACASPQCLGRDAAVAHRGNPPPHAQSPGTPKPPPPQVHRHTHGAECLQVQLTTDGVCSTRCSGTHGPCVAPSAAFFVAEGTLPTSLPAPKGVAGEVGSGGEQWDSPSDPHRTLRDGDFRHQHPSWNAPRQSRPHCARCRFVVRPMAGGGVLGRGQGRHIGLFPSPYPLAIHPVLNAVSPGALL